MSDFGEVCVPVHRCGWMGLIADAMRAYLQQLRQETGLRLLSKVFDSATSKPSKVIRISILKFFFQHSTPWSIDHEAATTVLSGPTTLSMHMVWYRSILGVASSCPSLDSCIAATST